MRVHDLWAGLYTAGSGEERQHANRQEFRIYGLRSGSVGIQPPDSTGPNQGGQALAPRHRDLEQDEGAAFVAFRVEKAGQGQPIDAKPNIDYSHL